MHLRTRFGRPQCDHEKESIEEREGFQTIDQFTCPIFCCGCRGTVHRSPSGGAFVPGHGHKGRISKNDDSSLRLTKLWIPLASLTWPRLQRNAYWQERADRGSVASSWPRGERNGVAGELRLKFARKTRRAAGQPPRIYEGNTFLRALLTQEMCSLR